MALVLIVCGNDKPKYVAPGIPKSKCSCVYSLGNHVCIYVIYMLAYMHRHIHRNIDVRTSSVRFRGNPARLPRVEHPGTPYKCTETKTNLRHRGIGLHESLKRTKTKKRGLRHRGIGVGKNLKTNNPAASGHKLKQKVQTNNNKKCLRQRGIRLDKS